MLNHRTETDVLAGMMGADSRRIDGLVESVGEVRGDMGHVRAEIGRMSKGVDALQEAMIGVARYTVLHEATRADLDKIRIEQVDLRKDMNDRLGKIEPHMPGLIEWRRYSVHGVVGVLSVVGLAVLALVMKVQGGP